MTLGTWARPKNLPRHITTAVEQVFATRGSHLGTFGPISQNANGIHIGPEDFLVKQKQILDLLELLGNEIDNLPDE